MFHVGQKVVCVNDDIQAENGEAIPKKDAVYTIRDLYICERGNEKLRLAEVRNPPMNYKKGRRECGFYCVRFRPVKTTSIQIFTKILNSAPTYRVEA